MSRRASLGNCAWLCYCLPISLQAQSESNAESIAFGSDSKNPQASRSSLSCLFLPIKVFPSRNSLLRHSEMFPQKMCRGISAAHRGHGDSLKERRWPTGGVTFVVSTDGKSSIALNQGRAFSELVRSNSLDEHGNPPSKKDVTVDFVVFSDGSTWGPGKRLESRRATCAGKFDAYKQMQIQKNKENWQFHTRTALLPTKVLVSSIKVEVKKNTSPAAGIFLASQPT
mgnify:CR=1 FL=1